MRALAALLLLLLAAPASAHMRFIAYATAPTTDSTGATVTNIAGLSFAARASVAMFARCYIVTTTANAATTAPRISVTGPAIGAGAVTIELLTYSAAGTTLRETANAYAAVSASATSAGAIRTINEMTIGLVNGATAGTVQLTINTSLDTSLVTSHIGSWCEYSYQQQQP